MVVVNEWVVVLNWLWVKDFQNIKCLGLVTYYEKRMLGVVRNSCTQHAD